MSTPCGCCSPSCVPPVTMRHSLAKPKASGMHVALDRLPASGLAAPCHHAPNAVTATGPCPSPRASTTPAVTGPWRGSSTAMPTLIHSPTGRNSGAGRRQRNTDRQKERTRRGYKEERRTVERQTHRRTEPESKRIISKVSQNLCELSIQSKLSSIKQKLKQPPGQSVRKTAVKRFTV